MSTPVFELDVSVRTDTGKGASRRLRRLHNAVPAVLYGAEKEPVPLTIDHDAILHATENEAFFSHIITLNLGKKKERAVIKDLQRHPARPVILHADFLRVSEGSTIQVRVPLHFINEEKCVGVKTGGGRILKSMTEIEVTCLPKDLPEYIEVDMLEVELGHTVHLSDISLPEGLSSVALSHGKESDHSVATVQPPRGGADEAEEDIDVEAAEDAGAEADDEGEAEEDS